MEIFMKVIKRILCTWQYHASVNINVFVAKLIGLILVSGWILYFLYQIDDVLCLKTCHFYLMKLTKNLYGLKNILFKFNRAVHLKQC